jgi:hypothetical protein
MNTDKIPLPSLPRALALLTGGPTRPYTVCYKAVLDGRIPVEQGENGRYSVAHERLPEIARALGLSVPAIAAE